MFKNKPKGTLVEMLLQDLIMCIIAKIKNQQAVLVTCRPILTGIYGKQ